MRHTHIRGLLAVVGGALLSLASLAHAAPFAYITQQFSNTVAVVDVATNTVVTTVTVGFSPTGGLVMGTRSGDLDPGVLLYLLRERGLDAAGLADLLNRRSGMLGRSLRDVVLGHAWRGGDASAYRAFGAAGYRVRRVWRCGRRRQPSRRRGRPGPRPRSFCHARS